MRYFTRCGHYVSLLMLSCLVTTLPAAALAQTTTGIDSISKTKNISTDITEFMGEVLLDSLGEAGHTTVEADQILSTTK